VWVGSCLDVAVVVVSDGGVGGTVVLSESRLGNTVVLHMWQS